METECAINSSGTLNFKDTGCECMWIYIHMCVCIYIYIISLNMYLFIEVHNDYIHILPPPPHQGAQCILKTYEFFQHP